VLVVEKTLDSAACSEVQKLYSGELMNPGLIVFQAGRYIYG
jgi:hypothetical protein